MRWCCSWVVSKDTLMLFTISIHLFNRIYLVTKLSFGWFFCLDKKIFVIVGRNMLKFGLNLISTMEFCKFSNHFHLHGFSRKLFFMVQLFVVIISRIWNFFICLIGQYKLALKPYHGFIHNDHIMILVRFVSIRLY